MADFLPQSVDSAGPKVIAATAPGILGTLARSFAIYGSANFIIRALNLLLIVAYAHYLRPSDYGIIYLAEIIASFLAIFSGLSIDSALERLYFQYHRDPLALRSYLGSAIQAAYLWMFLFLALNLILGWRFESLIPFHAQVPFYPYIAIAISTAALSQSIQCRVAIYQASARPQSYAILSFSLAVLTAVCCVYEVVIRRRGAAGMMEGKLVAAVLIFLVASWTMRSFLKERLQWRFVGESLSFSLPLIPHLMMASALVIADRFILARYRDLGEVGIYSLAYTFGMVMYLVTQSLSQAWLPMFFDLAGRDEENRKVLGQVCSGVAILLASIACVGTLLSPLFVHIALDERYRSAARIVPLVIVGYLFHGLFSLFDLSILHTKRTATVFGVSLVAFLANLALNLAMVPRWGMYGAAWATTIAYAIEAAGAFVLAQRLFTLPYRIGKILAGVAVVGGALGLTQAPSAGKAREVLIGAAVFPALGLLALLGSRNLRSAMVLLRSRGWAASTPPPAGNGHRQRGKGSEMEVEAYHRAFRERAYAMKKHHATRPHYDLRMEWNGVLLSWALPDGPSCRARAIREAIEMEDHSRANLLFEGVHDTGPMMLWDRGTWEPLPESNDVEAGLRRGVLRFTLRGEKLKGNWMLTRTNSARNAPRATWTLSKLADSFAENISDKSILKEQPNSVSTGRTMEQIVRDWRGQKNKCEQQTELFQEI
jgi:bifunctional non-homologous end joining protein LigD